MVHGIVLNHIKPIVLSILIPNHLQSLPCLAHELLQCWIFAVRPAGLGERSEGDNPLGTPSPNNVLHIIIDNETTIEYPKDIQRP